jgi:hypothetical protein
MPGRCRAKAWALLLLGAAAGAPAAEPWESDPAYQALARKAALVKPKPDEVRYQQLPWVLDLKEALRQAREEKRPLFFWAAGGRDRDGLPLERC